MRIMLCIKRKLLTKKSTDGKKNEVRGESNQEKKEQIMVKNKETSPLCILTYLSMFQLLL